MEKDRKSVEAVVKKIIGDQVNGDAEALKDEDRIKEDLGGDSLDEIEIAMAIEESLGIDISDEEAAGIKTVGQATEFAWRKISESNKQPVDERLQT